MGRSDASPFTAPARHVPMKLLWISNPPWMPTGYGSQTRQAGRRIAAAGYDIEFVANVGGWGNHHWEGHQVYGSGWDKYSRDTLAEDLDRSGADWAISLFDAWVYTEGRADPFAGRPCIAAWLPVDHYPVPQSLYPWLQAGHLPIAMSRFGWEQLTLLADAQGKPGHPAFEVAYVPHAVDDAFTRVDDSEFRARIDVPQDAYLVGIVAANTGTAIVDRKGFGDMSAALGPFMARHPDVYLYAHTVPDQAGGIDLLALWQSDGLPHDRIRLADQYALKKQLITDRQMAAIYSSVDVLLGTSWGEGFGLPGIEAQACGTPVILSNWTAQSELLGEPWRPGRRGFEEHPSGWLVAVDSLWDPRHGARWGKPLTGSIVRALESAYARRGDPTLRQAAITRAQAWRADRVFEAHWRPLLRRMEAALPNREQRRAKGKLRVVA